MTKVLIDSDILIELLRGRNEAICSQWAAMGRHAELALATTPINVAELWRGVLPAEQVALTNLLGGLTCLPLDYQCGELAGRLLARYASTHGLQIADAMIASFVISRQWLLWTRNRKHFPMPELRFYEP